MKKLLFLFLTFIASTPLFAQPQISVDTIIKDNCGGANTGAIMITVTGGTAPYSFEWSRPPLIWYTEDIYDIPAGLYILKVTDFAGASVNWDTIVLYGESIAVALDKSTYGDYQVSCYGCSDGWIEITFGTGNGNFTDWEYLWTDSKGFTKDGLSVNGLPAGNYNLEVRDTSGCMFSEDILLTQPDAPACSDTVAVYDTITVTNPVDIYDTVAVYDTVYSFTEIKDEVTFTNPLSEETLKIDNYGDYLLLDKVIKSAVIYNILGSVVKQEELTNKIPVSDLDAEVYLFIFETDSGKIFKRKIYIE